MTDERLKALYGRALARRETSSDGCDVTPEAMIDVLNGRATAAERERTMLAIMRDPHCRREFELLRALVEQAPAEARTRRARSPWPLRLAASIALFLAGGLIWRSVQEPTPDILRDGTPAAVQLLAPPADERVAADVRFTWHAVPRALYYEYSLIGADGRLIFASTQSDTSLVLPATTSLASGDRMRWWVEAVTAEGVRVRSALRDLRIAP